MRKFQDFDTGVIWTEDELREQFEEIPELLEAYQTFDDYLEHMIQLGKERVGGIIEV